MMLKQDVHPVKHPNYSLLYPSYVLCVLCICICMYVCICRCRCRQVSFDVVTQQDIHPVKPPNYSLLYTSYGN